MFNLFKKKKVISDGVIELIETEEISGSKENGYVPSIYYAIKLCGSNELVGHCDLRIGMSEEYYYAGNIGYNIKLSARGHNYAYKACLLLFKIAKEKYMLDSLIITCSPDNLASLKTCEKLGGTLLETVDVPSTHWLYARGETVKNIYEYKL